MDRSSRNRSSSSTVWNLRNESECEVCRAKISRRQWRQYSCCKRVDCRFETRRRQRKKAEQRRREWEQRVQERNQVAISAIRIRLGAHEIDTDQLVIVPVSRTADLRPANVGEKRKRRFRDNLMTQLTAVPRVSKDSPEAIDPDEPPPDPVKATACSACRGACCAQGGDEAFVTAETLRKFMNANPELRPREIVQAYLDRVPNKSIVDSCIFHTTTGCALPRSMRSTVCNSFFCGALTSLNERQLPNSGSVYVVSMSDSNEAIRVAATPVE